VIRNLSRQPRKDQWVPSHPNTQGASRKDEFRIGDLDTGEENQKNSDVTSHLQQMHVNLSLKGKNKRRRKEKGGKRVKEGEETERSTKELGVLAREKSEHTECYNGKRT